MYYDSTLTIQVLAVTKDSCGGPVFSVSSSTSMPCYVAETGSARDRKGNDGVMYDALAYVPYTDVNADAVVVYNGVTYEIMGVYQAPRRHHTELELKRRQP